jgi:arylsulfatase A-like enzyme
VASQVDVMPTLLGLAGISDYSGPGVDHTAAVHGAGTTQRDTAYVDTWFQGASRAAAYTLGRSCHVDFRTKEQLGDKVRRLPPMACYDQQVDPYQRTILEREDPELVSGLRAWRAARFAEYEAFDDTSDALMSRAMKEQLEALGYVDVDNEEVEGPDAEMLDADMADTDVVLDD